MCNPIYDTKICEGHQHLIDDTCMPDILDWLRERVAPILEKLTS